LVEEGNLWPQLFCLIKVFHVWGCFFVEVFKQESKKKERAQSAKKNNFTIFYIYRIH